ncbi:MAG: tetratricopeptide repeat protein [Chitinophagaceae bacterium]
MPLPAGMLASLALCLAMLLVLTGCSEPQPPEAPLAVVAPPVDLAELDLAVRQQFKERWDALQAATPGSKESATRWGEVGQWFDAYHYRDSADASYANAAQLDAGEPRWPYYRGHIALDRGDLDMAMEEFARAANLAPDMAAPRVQMGNIAMTQLHVDVAKDAFDRALKIDATDPEAQLGLGRVALEQGDPEGAREILEPLLQSQPDVGQLHYLIGLSWRQSGDRVKAAEHFSKVPQESLNQVPLSTSDPWMREVQLLDRGVVTLTRRGVREIQHGELRHGTLLLAQAVKANPSTAETHINYAQALRRVGRPNHARDELQEALRLAGDSPETTAKAHLALASLLTSMGQLDVAEPHLHEVLDFDPRSVDALLQLGRIKQRQGQVEAALGQYAAARDLAGEREDVCFWHAAMLLRLDRIKLAQDALQADIDRLGEARSLRLLLARLLAAKDSPSTKDVDSAKKLLQSAAGQPDVFFAETAAMVAAADGAFAQAISWQDEAVATLAESRRHAALKTARRRLQLYREGMPCRNPWEDAESMVTTKIRTSQTERNPS